MNRPLKLGLGLITLGAIAFLLMRSAGVPSGFATGDSHGPLKLWVYPSNDALNVSPMWDGKDAPQPMAPPNGYPSGPVLTLQVTSGGALSITEARVTREPQGDVIESTVLTSENDDHLKADSVALIPHEPLEPLTTYTVEVRGEASGESFSETWSFTTRREGCDLLEQDCNLGQGCFLLSTGKQCLWAGRGFVGEPCTYPNQCMAGLTCMGSSCVPFCDSREDAKDASIACMDRCPGGLFPVPGADEGEPARLCVLERCIEDPSVCGEDEGCYWLGGFLCAPAGTGAHGTECTQASDCARGTSCLGHEDKFTCHTLCGGPHMPDCESACNEEALLFDADYKVSFCP
jgi:hypothetical protein